MQFNTRFNHTRPPGITFYGESMTLQEFERECNINYIVDSFMSTGVLPNVDDEPLYGDFSNIGDFAAIQQSFVDTYAQFDALPSAVRKRFNNDPADLIAFINDSNNRDEAVKLGLINTPSVDNVDK